MSVIIWGTSIRTVLVGAALPGVHGMPRCAALMRPAKRAELVKALMDANFPEVQYCSLPLGGFPGVGSVGVG